MKTKTWSKKNIWSGAIAGLIAGVVVGFILIRMHAMSGIGGLIGMPNPLAGYIVHLVWNGILGIIFALIFNRISTKFFSCTVWGVVYGIIWWFLCALTLAPLMMGMAVSWNAQAMSQGIPMFVAHLVYGLVLGIVYYWMKTRK